MLESTTTMSKSKPKPKSRLERTTREKVWVVSKDGIPVLTSLSLTKLYDKLHKLGLGKVPARTTIYKAHARTEPYVWTSDGSIYAVHSVAYVA